MGAVVQVERQLEKTAGAAPVIPAGAEAELATGARVVSAMELSTRTMALSGLAEELQAVSPGNTMAAQVETLAIKVTVIRFTMAEEAEAV